MILSVIGVVPTRIASTSEDSINQIFLASSILATVNRDIVALSQDIEPNLLNCVSHLIP